MSFLLSNLLGWVGMILILLAYFLISTNRIEEDNRLYQILNFFGAIGIIINTFFQKAWPAMTLNIAWALIALITIYKTKRDT